MCHDNRSGVRVLRRSTYLDNIDATSIHSHLHDGKFVPRPYTLMVGASSTKLLGGIFCFFCFICIYFYFFVPVPFRSVPAFIVARCDKSMYLKKS